jgi:PAS domain-containing protein
VVSVTALRDAQDGIIGYLLIGTDNTARKQAEEALLKAGRLQSAIFNSANFSSIATDAKGVIQIFNVGAERMLGYTAAEVVNKITPPTSPTRRRLSPRESPEPRAGTTITPGLRGAGVQGLARHRGHLRAHLLPQGRQPLSRRGFGHGAARRAGRHHRLPPDRHRQHREKQAEEALLKAGALQSAIFNSANFSSIATDAKGVIQIFNVGAERMLGYTAAEVMNKITPADISDPQEADRARRGR